jgi:hypothetical protein
VDTVPADLNADAQQDEGGQAGAARRIHDRKQGGERDKRGLAELAQSGDQTER